MPIDRKRHRSCPLTDMHPASEMGIHQYAAGDAMGQVHALAGRLPQDERQEREIFVCHIGNLRHEYIGAGVAVARHIHSTAIIHRNAIAFIIPVAAEKGIPL
jgi:hypothetical protein